MNTNLIPAFCWYLLPLIPIIPRLVLIIRHWSQMKSTMNPDAQDRAAHRALLLGMAGFSFTGLIGMIVVDGTMAQDLKLPVYSLSISFVAYLAAMNLQSYKFHYWIDQIGDGLRDVANFSLIVAVLHTISRYQADDRFAALLGTVALSVWLFDFVIRLALDGTWLARQEASRK